MKNKLAFICLLFLTFFSVSSVFAQDSTSIKIILPQTDEWKVENVEMAYLRPIYIGDNISIIFEKTDSTKNSWQAKIPNTISGNYFFAIGRKVGFNLLVFSNDEIEISFDEETKPTFLKGKTAKENQITYNWNTDYFFSHREWANEDSTTFISKLDSMTKKVLFDYENSIKDFTPNTVFDVYFRNQLIVEQLQGFDSYVYDRNQLLKKNLSEKMPLEYYEAKPKLKMSVEENQLYSSEYISYLSSQIMNENCRKNEHEEINNATTFCTYQHIKTLKESKLKKLLIINILDELIDSWSQDENKSAIIFEEFKENYPNDEYIEFLEEKIALQKRFAKGQNAPTFSLKNKDGKQISLSDLKGKYVLLDFWATWCKPCLAQIPYSKKLEEEYKNEDIEFVYICIDDGKERWENHLTKENPSGIQLFADKEESDELRSNYNINGIPSYMLIDKEGKIITQKITPSYNGKEILETIFKEEK
ncbi:thiol-disulfide isomerase-like thioredoxin [Bernardetia litoralis DSM 6794]|uniref:Thiol-disulfide isomerase-like thioredoxin n=1 Tax=Bernardetia litoralis (strain ATCC 23117 / DSM 6794 / NBRC 15988 / NCIMB 1366 / Fx l1 / Sio-4) TaxID=880071 RepID=I4ALG7_BERLS|nr:TlpA disulfide reductase family protein [Bernardetia litoralis]AFM04802.1 thiol-disulfide isomerase-like thioredoxin [Bernardetia litoralis DSM 6794]